MRVLNQPIKNFFIFIVVLQLTISLTFAETNNTQPSANQSEAV